MFYQRRYRRLRRFWKNAHYAQENAGLTGPWVRRVSVKREISLFYQAGDLILVKKDHLWGDLAQVPYSLVIVISVVSSARIIQ